MNRTDYLDLAEKDDWTDPAAIALARRCTSAKSIHAAQTELKETILNLEKRSSIWSRTAGCSIAVVTVLTLGELIFTKPRDYTGLELYSVAAAVIGLFLLFAASLVAMMVVFERRIIPKHQLAMLEPIAGTAACQTVLQYIEGGQPEVLAWRDLVLEERGQLYGFDAEVMRCLAGLSRKAAYERAQTEQQQAIDEACRKIHGLAPTKV